MKYFANFLFLFVVIHATTYARYLLVELNNEEGEPNSAFLAEATCDAKKHSSWTTIVDTCPGYKLLLKSSTIFTAYTRCCEAVKADPECGNNWFLGPLTGTCFCEKRGYDCIRSGSVYTEYRFGEEDSNQLIQPQTNELIASPDFDDEYVEDTTRIDMCDFSACQRDPLCHCSHMEEPHRTCPGHICSGPWACTCFREG